MKLVLMTASSAHEKWADAARDLYKGKISHFHSLEFIEIRPTKNARAQAAQKVKEESEKILQALKSDDFVVVFDERGKKLDSIAFSKSLERVLLSGKKRCVFLLGGAYGLSTEVKSRADLQVSFSEMVFNHLVAELMALEQIYRAFTILKNIPYHNS